MIIPTTRDDALGRWLSAELVAPFTGSRKAPPVSSAAVLDVVPLDRPAGLAFVAEAAGVARNTAAKALAKLVERGQVERVARGQYRRTRDSRRESAREMG